ncbi:hypothetical protein B0H14DRAFT_2757810, partial [Mycena olivaceomarginata]
MSGAMALGAFGAVANGFTIVSALTGSGPDAVGHITNRKRTTDIIAEQIKLINADVDWVMSILNTYGQQLTQAERHRLFDDYLKCKSDLNMVERELNAPPNDTDYKFRIRNLKLFKKVSKEARIRAITEKLMGRSNFAKKFAKGVSEKVMAKQIRDMDEGSNSSSSATGTPGSRTYPPSSPSLVPTATDSVISLILVHGHSPRASPTGQVPGVQPGPSDDASGNAGTPLQRWTTTDTNNSLSAKPLVH